jgi:flagellar biosynthetic protein FlhB
MEGAEQDRSEQATPYKLQRARGKGSVARGMDLGYLTTLAVLLVYLWVAGAGLGGDLARVSRDTIVTGPSIAGGAPELFGLVGYAFAGVARPVAFLAIAVFAAVLVFDFLQTGVVFSAEPLKADFSRLNPAKGLKRIFTKRMLIETAKNVFKFAVYSATAWLVVRHAIDDLAAGAGDAAGLAAAMFAAALRMIACFTLAAIFFAAIDQLIVRKEFAKNMRMSRRELRREVKDREGEPRQKQKRKQLHAAFASASQSMRALKGADVVVTNPTHYAVALRYDPDAMAAPFVVSRGVNGLAERLKKLAFLHGVAIVEDRALARALYRQCALDAPVPEALYREVAALYHGLRPARAATAAA